MQLENADNTLVVSAESLAGFDFTPYGKAIVIPDSRPTRETDLAKFYQDVHVERDAKNVGIHLLSVMPNCTAVEEMEFHHTPELFVGATTPYVMYLALSNGQPRKGDVVAVRVDPGQSILLNPYTWHSTPRSIGNELNVPMVVTIVTRPRITADCHFMPIAGGPVCFKL